MINHSQFSDFGKIFARGSGIESLMDDLGTALNEQPDLLFMGGGNPGNIPAVDDFFSHQLEAILQDKQRRHSLFGIYQSPQGDLEFRKELALMLHNLYGWSITPANIAVSNGSQSAFFLLFNLLAGQRDQQQTTIHLPITPEYIGYSDAGVSGSIFSATRPHIELIEDHRFKYQVDFEELSAHSSQAAAFCLSRPTNPTGNVITDEELARLDKLAQQRNIPLIIDGAYGLPFPNLVFTQAQPMWNRNTILVLSLSKLGLPGTRTGLVIADEPIVQAFAHANTVSSLASGNLGPALCRGVLANKALLKLSTEHIRPFYLERMQFTLATMDFAFKGLNYRIHQPEGAIFLWLWFPNLPISSQELYQRLKTKGLLVVPGHNFFPGLHSEWQHSQECIRVSYAQPFTTIQAGIEIIAQTLKELYGV